MERKIDIVEQKGVERSIYRRRDAKGNRAVITHL